MSAERMLCAAIVFAALAGPACASPFDSLRWRVEDAIADTAARKVEAALSGGGSKAKEKPAKPAPAPAVTTPAPIAPIAAPVAAPPPIPVR
ncbi:MAG: hypothetical protein ACREEO_08320 [Phenylobacterium sp.]